MYDRKRVLALIIIVIVIIIAIAAIIFYSTQNTAQNPQPIGPQISGNNTTTNGTAAVVTISIQNNTFVPNTVTVKTGTNVQWVNHDNTQHQIVSDSGAFTSPVLTNSNAYNFFFAKAGVYGYHCGIHPNETGTITVQG